MQRVLVLDKEKKPLMPCHPARAKELLKKGKAAVFRRFPFTIILKLRSGGDTQPLAFKTDPGSKKTGVALVADFKRGKTVVWAAEIEHRGQAIRNALLSRAALRGGRRGRHTRYRQPRFLNRAKRSDRLPPSLESRIYNVTTWLSRLRRWSPISSISMELVKFDTQKMQNPEISGVEYQRGELQGYDVREYLLEKWGRKCAYCKVKNVPLQIEHVVPKTRGGSNRASNLTLACEPCNQAKGNKTATEFGHPEIQAKAKTSMKDAAVMNSTRWALFKKLKATRLPLECGSGARTKFNRTKLSLQKMHWVDAACVGISGADVLVPNISHFIIKATGHGRRQRCQPNAFGFPRAHAKRAKTFKGWRTGDMGRAIIPKGKYAGTVFGKVTIRHSPVFRIGKVSFNHTYLSRLHCADGYEYTKGEAVFTVALMRRPKTA